MESKHVVKYATGKQALRVNDGIASAETGVTLERDASTPNNDFVGDNIYQAVDSDLLGSAQLLDKMLQALENQDPLSVVSVGQTEAFVMAQYAIYSEQEFMSHREAYNANLGEKSGFLHRGIRFPNRAARDEAIAATRKADIVAYNTIENNARDLTERVFSIYHIRPRMIFEANIRRVFMYSQPERFEALLRERKLLLISSLASEAKTVLENKYRDKLGLQVVGAISIHEYDEIPRVKAELEDYDFDLCFIAAGVNALILSSYIAERFGKVAFDIGWGMKAIITGQVVTDSFITDVIGLENLFKM